MHIDCLLSLHFDNHTKSTAFLFQIHVHVVSHHFTISGYSKSRFYLNENNLIREIKINIINNLFTRHKRKRTRYLAVRKNKSMFVHYRYNDLPRRNCCVQILWTRAHWLSTIGTHSVTLFHGDVYYKTRIYSHTFLPWRNCCVQLLTVVLAAEIVILLFGVKALIISKSRGIW